MMEPLPQERKQKKGRKVVTVLWKVLLLNCCRGAEHEEDQNESHGTRPAPNTGGTCAEEQRTPNRSILKRALGLFTKWNRRRVENNGQIDAAAPSSEGAPLRGDDSGCNDAAGPSSEGAPLRGDDSGRNDAAGPSSEGAPLRADDSGRNDTAGPSSDGAPLRGDDSGAIEGVGPRSEGARLRGDDSGQIDATGPSSEGAPLRGDDSGQIDATGPSSEGAPLRSQKITIVHESAFDWILPGGPEEAPTQSSAENCKKVTSAPHLHEPRPGPSQHQDVQDYTVLVMDNVYRGPMVFSSCEEQSKTEVNAVTPELLKLKAGPSHIVDLQGCTITLPEKSSSSSRKLSEAADEVKIWIDDTAEETTSVPAPSNSDLRWLSVSLVSSAFLFAHGFLY